MTQIRAFVGHSFAEEDADVVRKFLDYFDELTRQPGSFSWEHAEDCEPRALSAKVLRKIEGKNLFIGICTAREFSMSQHAVRNVPFLGFSMIRRSLIRRKTSDWILQEVGLAIGKGMSLILLVEDEVDDVGGLQGDLNFIRFSRHYPEKSFQPLLEMLRCLQPGDIQQPAPAQAAAGTSGEPGDSEEIAPVSAPRAPYRDLGDDSGFEEYVDQLLFAVWHNDGARETAVIDAFDKSPIGRDEKARRRFNGWRLYYHHIRGNENNLGALLRLCEDGQPDPLLFGFVARLYRQFKDDKKAAAAELKVAEYAESPAEKVNACFTAAADFHRSSMPGLIGDLVEKARSILQGNPELRHDYYQGRARLAKVLGQNEDYYAFAECALREHPENDELRFDLAYAYSEAERSDLSFHHYEILTNNGSQGSALNNLGAEADALQMPGRAVTAYEEAAKTGSARAEGNLGFKYMERGFFDQARERTQKGAAIDPKDERVIAAASAVSNAITDEEKKADLARLSARKWQEAYVRYAAALDADPIANLPSDRWIVDAKAVTAFITGGMFLASATYEQERFSLGSALLGERGLTSKETVTIRYEGAVVGRTAWVDITESRSPTAVSLLGGPLPRKVLLLFDSDEITMFDPKATADKLLVTWSRVDDKVSK